MKEAAKQKTFVGSAAMHLLKKKGKKSSNKTREKSLKAKGYSRIKQYAAHPIIKLPSPAPFRTTAV